MATFNGDENNNLLIGTDQADFLDGGLGVDTMQGGLGDDSYVVNDSSDVISGEQKSSLERVDIPQSPYYGLVSMSTDGTKIAYIESDNSGYNRRVIVVDVVTKQKEVVAVVDAYSQVRFSIDNQSLILDNQLIKNLVSGEEATITNTLTTFDNWQTDLVPFALTGSNVSLIKNTITGEVSRVGLDLNDLQPDHSNTNDVFLSLDGSKLIFQSFATNLVANDTNNSPDIFVKDVQTGEISLVSTSSTGEIASNPNTNVGSWNASISADGKKIAFLSGASNLVTDDANNLVDVFVKDLITGEVQQVASNAGANFVDFSLDGTKVLWGDGLNSLYVKDLNTGVITDAGAVANANTYAFGGSLVADGSKALTIMGAYASFASGFTVEYPTAIYVKDLTVSAESNVDTVTSSAYEYTLPENVENLWLSENATVGIGNSSDNQIMGNSAGNLLNGMAGEDYIHGHDGNDLLIGGSGNDTLVGGDGQNTLLGGMGNDILYGKTGDIYVFEDNMGNDTLAVWQQHGEKILDFSNLSFNDLTIKASFSGGFNYSLKLGAVDAL
jgi:Ca2+-binding RTX toxin-like protein